MEGIDLTAVITQEELSRYLNQNVKGVKNANVAVTPDKTIVNGELTIGGFAKVTVNLEGKITE